MIFLIHGGLWEDMTADRFWTRPGITDGLRRHGFDVLAPDRLRRPPDWPAEAEHLAAFLPGHPVTVVAGSNGCSAAGITLPGVPDRLLAGRTLRRAPGRVRRLGQRVRS